MGRRALALIIATIVALIGVVALFAYVKSADRRAVADQAPTQVWVTTEQVPAGTTLKRAVDSDMLKQTTVATKGAPSGALKTVNDENSDLVAVTDLSPGEFVLASRFGKTPQGEKAIEVPKGMVAISVELSDPARVGEFVTPGSHIVIYDSYKLVKLEDSDAADKFNSFDFKGTSVLLDDVLVIGMGTTSLGPVQPDSNGEDNNQNSSRTSSFLVTVAVPPDDSVKLVHGINTRVLYAGLRGAEVDLKNSKPVTDVNIGEGATP
jgi:pilus assembly protein CpaB